MNIYLTTLFKFKIIFKYIFYLYLLINYGVLVKQNKNKLILLSKIIFISKNSNLFIK